MLNLCGCFRSALREDQSPDLSVMQDALSTPEVYSVLALDPAECIVGELRRKSELARKYILDELNEFIENGHSGSVRFWFKPRSPDAPLIAKGEVLLINVDSIDFILQVLTESRYRPFWDLDIVNNIHIRDILSDSLDHTKEKARQVYNSFKGRFGQPGRDFVFNEYTCKINENKAVFLIYSNPADECPPGFEPGSRGPFLRAHTFLGAYLVEKESNGVRIHFVNQTDIGGSLPDWISNLVLKKSPEKLSFISNYISRLTNRNTH